MPEPVPEVDAADDGWGFTATSKKKKGKKGFVQELEMTAHESTPEPVPDVGVIDDGWDFSRTSKKKKGKKDVFEQPR